MLYEPITHTIQQLQQQTALISSERSKLLTTWAAHIAEAVITRGSCQLIFICTHNSRRSHIAQAWAQAAAYWYQLKNVHCFSGGTEVTAFNPRAVRALQQAGFAISKEQDDANPRYYISFATETPAIKAFSKRYDHADNPSHQFMAVMTCGHADENCPLITGAEKRIALKFDDPKAADDTPQEDTVYYERVCQIGREILFAFAHIKV